MKKFSFRWAFILLGFGFFIVGIMVYYEFNEVKNELSTKIFEETKSNILSITENYKKYLLELLPKNDDWYVYLKSHINNQKRINKSLSLLALNEIKYIYLLKPYKNRFVFLADGSKSDKALFGESFEPIDRNQYLRLKPHFFTHKRLKDIWITFVNPVIVNKQIKAIIVVDMPLSVWEFINYVLKKLENSLNILLLFTIAAIILLAFFSYFDDKREKEKEKILKDLEEINKNLQENVKEKVNELRQKDALIINQSKLVALGEMLNMIAHQWRQPLNALSAFAIRLELKTDIKGVDKKEVLEFTKFVQEETQKLSTIIDDFMKLSKSDDKEEEFYLKEVVDEIVKLVKVQLQTHNIDIKIHVYEYFKLKSYKKVIEHILLNLVSNARDALDEVDIPNKEIRIYTVQDDEFIKIIVYDNAGTISEEIADRIFEPYFTTKEEGKGTGLGLYMSKKLAQEKLRGELYFENKENGVEFILKIRRDSEL